MGDHMLSLTDARNWLRIDGTDNDEVIAGLLLAAPDYIEVATGMTPERQEEEPLATATKKFLLQLWYNAEQTDSDKLQRTIDSLLKTLTMKARG